MTLKTINCTHHTQQSHHVARLYEFTIIIKMTRRGNATITDQPTSHRNLYDSKNNNQLSLPQQGGCKTRKITRTKPSNKSPSRRGSRGGPSARGSGTPPPPPMENHKSVGFLNSARSDPLENHRAAEPAMLGNYRPARETPFSGSVNYMLFCMY